MLNEQEKRRPDFVGGTPVTLADGQEWTLAKPFVRFVPDDSELGFKVRLARNDGGAYTNLIARLDALQKNEQYSIGDLANLEMQIARNLLLANYDLNPCEVGELIQFSYGDDDPEGTALREAVMGVALGNGPKPLDGGDDSPAS